MNLKLLISMLAISLPFAYLGHYILECRHPNSFEYRMLFTIENVITYLVAVYLTVKGLFL